MSSSLLPLRHLAVMVETVRQNVEIEQARLCALMKSTDAGLSAYHSRFAELLRQYSAFAGAYKHDIYTFSQSLLDEVEREQEKAEQERVERMLHEKLEVMSNKSNKSNKSNLEITENVQDTEYSPATSMTMTNDDDHDEAVPDVDHDETRYMSVESVPPPQEMKSRDSIPTKHVVTSNTAASTRVTAPKSQTKRANTRNNNKSTNRKSQKQVNSKLNTKKTKNKNKSQKNEEKKTTTSNPAAVAQRVVVADNINHHKNDNDNDVHDEKVEDEPYVYDAERVHATCWRFAGPVRSSTLLHISNIPRNIKVAAIQFFVMKRAKVSMRQIEETQLKQSVSGVGNQYALLRFRSDVAMDTVVQFMNSVNTENAQIAEQRKQNDGDLLGMAVNAKNNNKKDKDGKRNKNKKQQSKTSWQTRVFVRLNDNRRWYECEEDMYADPVAKTKLFIRNFDMLDEQCHEKMSNILLEFGDICHDVEMGTDSFGDPYCIVRFKSLEDAVYCRNSSIDFNGRWLEIEYLNARTMQRLF